MQTPEEFSEVVGRHHSGDLMRFHESYHSAVDAVTYLIRARDAEIKRECAERAVKCLCHFEHEWVERNGEMFPRHEDLLRAAIIGEEE